MPWAYNLTRRDIWYRHESFSKGLVNAGYQVKNGVDRARPGDVLLIWNRYGEYHAAAERFEREGGSVIVAENGYLRGPKDGGDHYALALDGHNGSGRWPEGGRARLDALAVDLAPWRSAEENAGGHVLVCPNRSFGRPGYIQPVDWPAQVKRRLAAHTRREIRVRPHPGNEPPKKPLADDLAGAWAVVIWASSAGVHALLAGVPVICEAPAWICKAAADSNAAQIEKVDDRGGLQTRDEALRRLAWAQWNLAEIASGAAFDCLLHCHENAIS